MLVLSWYKFGQTWKWIYGKEKLSGGWEKIFWRGNADFNIPDEANSHIIRKNDVIKLKPPEIKTEIEECDSSFKVRVNPDTILRGGFGKKDDLTIREALEDCEDDERVFPEDISMFWF